MEKNIKKEDNERKSSIITLILGILVLVVTVIGAAFAYLSATSTNNASSTTVTSNIGEAGNISLSNPNPTISIGLTASDMAIDKENTSYYSTIDTNKNYETTETPVSVAKVLVVGGDNTATYTCTFNLIINLTGDMASSLVTGDAILTLSNGHTETIDLSSFTSSRVVTLNLSGTDREKNINASLKITNRAASQNNLAGKSLNVNVTSSAFGCTLTNS